MTFDPENRAAILAAVEAWLDAHPEEAPPAGVDPSLIDDPTPPPDLAAVVAAMLASRHEVKLQTKAFKRVEERLDATLVELSRTRESASRVVDPTDALVELFDRLRRCERACVEAARDLPWFSARASVQRRIAGLGSGIELTAARAGELLAGFGLRPFDPIGEAFDPRRMRAVGQGVATAAIASGHVAETVRTGIERDGVVVRAAEVVVARDAGERERKAAIT